MASDGRPALAFAFDPLRTTGVFTPAQLSTLGEMCRIVDTTPIEDFTAAGSGAVLRDAEVLVTGWGCPRIGAEVLAAAPRLKLIAHSAGTVKSLIAPDVYDAGVAVINAASANALPVAEFTLAAILFANKRVLQFRDLYRGRRGNLGWRDLPDDRVGNFGSVVGIVGASRVGRRLLALLRPHDLEVVVYDPYLDAAEAEALGARSVELDELMARADVVSLHAPALESTRHMIDARRLALMRDGTTLINTARGSVIDELALERELIAGRIFAVLDVTMSEPLATGSPLYDLPNVLLTPHIAGALGNERQRLGALIVAEIERFIRGVPLLHAVAKDTLLLQA